MDVKINDITNRLIVGIWQPHHVYGWLVVAVAQTSGCYTTTIFTTTETRRYKIVRRLHQHQDKLHLSPVQSHERDYHVTKCHLKYKVRLRSFTTR